MLQIGEMRPMSKVGNGSVELFRPQLEGHLHWCCMGDLGLDMDLLVPSDDMPPDEDDFIQGVFG